MDITIIIIIIIIFYINITNYYYYKYKYVTAQKYNQAAALLYKSRIDAEINGIY